MEENNPFATPQADLEAPPEPSQGPLIPWEDKLNYPRYFERVSATVKLLLTNPSAAGSALGASKKVGPAIMCYAAVALPLVWLFQFVIVLFGPMNRQAVIMEMFGMPKFPEPTAQQVTAQRIIGLVMTVLFPLLAAIGLALNGAMNHVGIWMLRGLRANRGIEITFRATIYFHTVYALLSCVFNLQIFLPVYAALVVMGIAFLVLVAAWVYQGFILARAHATETWRGVLGVFLPWVILGCCCGGFLGLLLAIARAAAHR